MRDKAMKTLYEIERLRPHWLCRITSTKQIRLEFYQQGNEFYLMVHYRPDYNPGRKHFKAFKWKPWRKIKRIVNSFK